MNVFLCVASQNLRFMHVAWFIQNTMHQGALMLVFFFSYTSVVLAEWKPPVYDNARGIILVTASTRRNSPNVSPCGNIFYQLVLLILPD